MSTVMNLAAFAVGWQRPVSSSLAIQAVRARPPILADGRQAAVVDAGSFTLLERGVRVGREVFTIRQTPPPDAGFLLEGAIAYPTRRLVPELRTDSAGSPVHYQMDEFEAGRRQQQLTLQVARGHGSERVQTSRGESAVEFMARPGARLLDEDVFAQYYFIARPIMHAASQPPGQSVIVPLLVPRRGGVIAVPLTVVGEERLEIAGQTRSATHLRMEPGRGDERDVWVDAEGRVLRVALPARSLVAMRDDLPP